LLVFAGDGVALLCAFTSRCHRRVELIDDQGDKVAGHFPIEHLLVFSGKDGDTQGGALAVHGVRHQDLQFAGIEAIWARRKSCRRSA
jgi:hypothetical protein